MCKLSIKVIKDIQRIGDTKGNETKRYEKRLIKVTE